MSKHHLTIDGKGVVCGVDFCTSWNRCVAPIKFYQLKKPLVNKILAHFQDEFQVKFKNKKQAENLVTYAIAKFIVESNDY
jgi:hypothetical protein